MPKEMEKRLWKRARNKFPKDKKRQERYVYGTLRRVGWKPPQERNYRKEALGI